MTPGGSLTRLRSGFGVVVAPEFNLIGVVAAAPSTELATLLADDIDTKGGRNLTATTLWSWSRVFRAPIETGWDCMRSHI